MAFKTDRGPWELARGVRETTAATAVNRSRTVAFDLDPAHRACDTLILVFASFASFGRHPLLLAAAMVLALQFIPNLYRHRLTLSALDEAPRLLVAGGISAFVAVVLTDQEWTETGIVRFWFLVTVALFLGRAVTNVLIRATRRRWRATRRRTAILGGGQSGADLCDILLEQPELGLQPVVVVDMTRRVAYTRSSSVPVKVVEPDGLADFLVRVRASVLIVADSQFEDRQVLEMLRDCVRLDTEIFILPTLSDYISLEGAMDRVRSYPLARVRRAPYRSFAWGLKRPIDMVLSATALILLSPVLLVFAVLIKLEDRGAPVLFRQTRIGVDEKPFELLKFRSMTPKNVHESDTTWNIAGDPRITRLGAFMRRYSIDEFPQIYNVLRGDMALVGPRPERPTFVEKFNEEHEGYRARHRVPVGLTGWAAANGLRGDTSIRERVKFDNFYIENWSLWLDFKIIVLTLGAVFRGSGS